MKIKSHDISECLVDTNGKLSSKRIVMYVVLACIVCVTFGDLVLSLHVSEYIFEGLMWIIMFSMGAGTAELFSRKNKTHTINKDT